MSQVTSLRSKLGDRLYNAANVMFNRLFDAGESGVLIGAAATKFYLRTRETKVK